MNGSSAGFEARCLEVLKAIGKTLSQLNLYSASHPAVKQMTSETVAELSGLLAESPKGELAYSIDQGKLVANGKIVGLVSQVPNSIPQIFLKFRLDSIAFKSGLREEELSAFSEMAAMRPDAAKAVDPGAYLRERGIVSVVLNEAVYAKVAEAEEASESPSSVEKTADEFIEKTAERPIESMIEALVGMAVKDPKQRALLMEAVLKRVREDLEKKVAEATKELSVQKRTIENVQVRTQGVVESMATGVIVVDEQGKVLTMNPEAEELFGKRLSEMAGLPVLRGAGDEHLLTMTRSLAIPKDRLIEAAVDTAASDDVRRTMRASTAVIQDEAGKPVGVVQALSDKAKHRELDRMEREFVAHVTHELRAPLSSIKAALEIVEEMTQSQLDDDARKMFLNAQKNTERLEDLVNSILDFSKIESGQMTVLVKPCRPEELAKEAVEGMRPWAQKKGLRLEFEAASGLPQVSADWKRTVQVIVNLLSNAIKFTPRDGRISVTVSASKEKFVMIAVSDTGPGIPKSEQQRVFEKFQQIQSGERHVGGTGLGLSIAKALVHMQNGRMWLESEPGKGASFYFTIPAIESELAERPAVQPSSSQEPPPWWKLLLGLK